VEGGKERNNSPKEKKGEMIIILNILATGMGEQKKITGRKLHRTSEA